MKKKILSFLLVMVMMLGCVSFTNTAFADTEAYNEEALQHMINLGILPSDTDGDDIISRGEFALAIYNVSGKNVNIPFEQLYYDVQADDEISNAVMYTSKNGYMVGAGGYFRPDDAITYIEAMTVIARVMNYTEYAKVHGDYTSGYYTTAKTIGLLNGTGIVSTDTPLTYSTCATMLYNAMRIGMNKLSSISTLYYKYQASDKIFAYEMLGYNYAKGVMTSNGYVDVTGKEKQIKNSVVIDNARYNTKLLDDSYRFFVGQEVSVFYDDDFNIKSIALTGTSNTVSVNRENFISKSANTFKYIEDETECKIKVADKAIYFKNGEVVMGYNATGFADSEFADISFIDSNGDDIYECVFVNVYDTFVVSNVFSNGVLYSDGNVKSIDLTEDCEKDVYVYNAKGELKSVQEIKKGYVVSVIENDEFVYVIYSNSMIKGEVLEKDTYTVNVDGLNIDIPNGTSKILKDISVGNDASIYLDFADRGVYATKNINTSKDELLGYVAEGFFKNDFEKVFKLRIYNSDSELVLYNVAANFSVDGTKYKLSSLTAIPVEFYNKDVFKSTVVFYQLNENNEIKSITFPKTSLDSDEDGFIQTAVSQTAYKISNGTLNNRTVRDDNTYFSGKEFLNDNTVVFVIPTDLENEESFAIITMDDVAESTDYVWDLFHFSKYNGFVDVAVMHSDYAALSYDTKLSVVTSVSRKLDGNGVERVAVKYYTDSAEYVAMADETFEIKDYIIDKDGVKVATTIPVTALKPGDAVRMTVGTNGLIRQGERIYEYEKGFKGSSKGGAYATASLFMNAGYVAYNDNTLIRLADTKAECVTATGDVFKLTGAICSSAKIIIVEENHRGVEVNGGTMADIAIGDYVVYQSRTGVVQYIMVYKDK